MKLSGDSMCFACGRENPISLGLEFELNSHGQAVAAFIARDVHQGYDNIMHGGLVSTLLDEAMAKVLYLHNIKAVTAEMKTRFKKPVKIGDEVEIIGIFNNKHGKLLFTEAYLKDKDDRVIARAEAKFIEIKD